MFTRKISFPRLTIKAEVLQGAQSKLKTLTESIRKFSVISVAWKLLVFSLWLSLIPFGPIQTKAANYETNVSLDKNNPKAVVLNTKKTEIAIGQSKADEEKAKAEQVKRAVAFERKVSSYSTSTRDPEAFRPLYKAAAAQFGIPWQLIEAVHEVESGKSGTTSRTSYAGAQGPMQFMPGTWRAYAIDGNGDGSANINDVTDAIYTGAHYLARSGADEGRIDDALFNYNHSWSYVNKVKTIAYEIGL